MLKKCVLYNRECVDCGECDLCDITPEKVCDNCGKCIETKKDFNSVKIDRVVVPKRVK